VVPWQEFLDTDPEVPSSIPGAATFPGKEWIVNGLLSASLEKLRWYLEEIVGASV
jgi:hypothetical protein